MTQPFGHDVGRGDEDDSLEFRIEQSEIRLHVLEALVQGLSDLPRLMEILMESEDAEDAAAQVGVSYGLDKIQASAVLDLQFRRVTKLDRARIEENRDEILDHLVQMRAARDE